MHCVWQLIALILSWNIFMFVCLFTCCFYRMKLTNKQSNSSDDYDSDGCVSLWKVEKCVNLNLTMAIVAVAYVCSVGLSGCANVEIPLLQTSPTSLVELSDELICVSMVLISIFIASIEKLYQNRLAWFCTTIRQLISINYDEIQPDFWIISIALCVSVPPMSVFDHMKMLANDVSLLWNWMRNVAQLKINWS